MKWTPHKLLPIPSDEEIAVLEPQELVALHSAREEAIRNERKDRYRYGMKFPNWMEVEEQLEKRSEALVSGGNRCLGAEQEIFDPVANVSRKVSEITEDFHVYAWDGHRKVVAKAERPFRKSPAGIFRVTLSNGEALHCSRAHLILTPDGWRPLGSLSPGHLLLSDLPRCELSRDPSILELGRKWFAANVRRLTGKAANCLDRCFEYCRQCGGQPQIVSAGDSGLVPSRSDVPKRSDSCGSIRHWRNPYAENLSLLGNGDSERKFSRIHWQQQTARPSILDDQHQNEAPSADTESRVFCKPCKSASALCVDHETPRNQQRFAGLRLVRSFLGFVRRGIEYVFPWTENKLSPLFVKIEKVDFLRNDTVWDFTVPVYENYIAAGVISHNSSKTQFGAYLVVKAAIENPMSEIMCFAQNHDVSVRQQQSAVYEWLPEELKSKQTTANSYISYSRKNGFTDSSCILPNGSRIIFKYYSQFQNNPTILEGAELGSNDPKVVNLGAWLDEYLGSPELVNTMRFRLATRDAKMLLTFTPIFGYTETVGQYQDGAKVLRSRPAELLGGEIIPTMLECKNINGTVHYFWSQDNPFGGYDRIKETLIGKPKSEILVRAYGVPTKSATTKFPKFNLAVNVVKPEQIPTEGITRYHLIDPAGSKNWFMTWIAVDGSGTFWVYREWPGVDVGDWAEWNNGKWTPGEGAKGQGFGILDYVELIHNLEGDEEIFERLIDPRLGAAKYQGTDGSSSIIEDLSDQNVICIPAPGLEIDDGLQALISKMSYDVSKPLDSLNRPHFYISEDCCNIIKALAEYTGVEGLKEAWKDPIDTLRYAAVAAIDHCDYKNIQVTRTGSGGY